MQEDGGDSGKLSGGLVLAGEVGFVGGEQHGLHGHGTSSARSWWRSSGWLGSAARPRAAAALLRCSALLAEHGRVVVEWRE